MWHLGRHVQVGGHHLAISIFCQQKSNSLSCMVFAARWPNKAVIYQFLNMSVDPSSEYMISLGDDSSQIRQYLSFGTLREHGTCLLPGTSELYLCFIIVLFFVSLFSLALLYYSLKCTSHPIFCSYVLRCQAVQKQLLHVL